MKEGRKGKTARQRLELLQLLQIRHSPALDSPVRPPALGKLLLEPGLPFLGPGAGNVRLAAGNGAVPIAAAAD